MPNRDQELIGGLQNALSRGENINKAKQSFISAGYKPEEIEAAAQKISTNPKIIQQTQTPSIQEKPQSQTTIEPKQKKQISKKLIIILISISALILVGAILLGLFWGKIFT